MSCLSSKLKIWFSFAKHMLEIKDLHNQYVMIIKKVNIPRATLLVYI